MKKRLIPISSLICSLIFGFSNNSFAQRVYSGWDSDYTIDARIMSTEIRSRDKFLFLYLKDDYYAVVELLECMPEIKVNPRIKVAQVKGLIKFKYPGTINGGPLYLANATLCDVDIVVSSHEHKRIWQKKIRDAINSPLPVIR